MNQIARNVTQIDIRPLALLLSISLLVVFAPAASGFVCEPDDFLPSVSSGPSGTIADVLNRACPHVALSATSTGPERFGVQTDRVLAVRPTGDKPAPTGTLVFGVDCGPGNHCRRDYWDFFRRFRADFDFPMRLVCIEITGRDYNSVYGYLMEGYDEVGRFVASGLGCVESDVAEIASVRFRGIDLDPSSSSIQSSGVFLLDSMVYFGGAACSDEYDNDLDGLIDLDDPECFNYPLRDSESLSRRCGLGFEFALLLPTLMWLRQRRRRLK